MPTSVALAALLLFGACVTAAHSGPAAIYFHSDLPLKPFKDQDMWPRAYGWDSMDGKYSPFGFGDWALRPTGCSDDTCLRYVRLDSGYQLEGYGFDETDWRRELSDHGSPALIFKLEAGAGSTLFALQIGYRGGSRYIVVSATPDGNGDFRTMTLLDAQCLTGAGLRWRRSLSDPPEPEEDYCVVPSMAALRTIARAALNRAPLASLTFLGHQDDKR
jgi:hypothetical protein